MPEIENHPPSTFCWLELATSDQQGAKHFYSQLFGWSCEDTPMGGGQTYTLLRLRGKDVAALFQMDPERRKQGVPPHWVSYVAVESADQVAKKARELGAKVMAEPFDVMDVGRMAVLQDPTGATFSVWQPRKHRGAAIINEVGAACWYELSTRDTAAASRFYTQLFGWNTQSMNEGGMQYTVFRRGEQGIAGMMAMPAQAGDTPANWAPYFAVSDCDQSVEKAKQLGGKVLMQPTDIPRTGRFAVLKDPQGAMFSILRPQPM